MTDEGAPLVMTSAGAKVLVDSLFLESSPFLVYTHIDAADSGYTKRSDLFLPYGLRSYLKR